MQVLSLRAAVSFYSLADHHILCASSHEQLTAMHAPSLKAHHDTPKLPTRWSESVWCWKPSSMLQVAQSLTTATSVTSADTP